jgi:hypothetical protein
MATIGFSTQHYPDPIMLGWMASRSSFPRGYSLRRSCFFYFKQERYSEQVDSNLH